MHVCLTSERVSTEDTDISKISEVWLHYEIACMQNV